MSRKKTRIIAFILLIAVVVTSVFAIGSLTADAYYNAEAVILDVDMCGDVDDIMAIRIAENYDTIGKIDLLAVTSTVKGNEKAIAGFLTRDGHNTTPVGESPYVTDTTPASYYGKFQETESTNEIMDAVKLMRRILSESEKKVSIVTTGYLTNLYGLMISAPDEYSSLDGMSLIREKVREVHVTGGVYPSGFDNNFGYVPFAGVAASHVFKNWESEVPLIIYTSDLGGPLMCGSTVSGDTEDYLGWALVDRGVEEGSYSWDAFTMWMFANLGESKIHGIKYAKCEMDVETGGGNAITNDRDGRFYRIIKTFSDDYYRNAIDENLVLI